jgi:hypothetical protein
MRGANVSTVVTAAIAREVRLAALTGALGEADQRFGPVAEELVVEAERELAEAMRRGGPKRRRRSG